VLTDYVRDKVLTVPQAVRAVEDILFRTSNNLYDLGLPLEPLPSSTYLLASKSSAVSNLQALTLFLKEYPDTKFLRLQYLDYTATSRLRAIPVKKALALLQNNETLNIGIIRAAFGLLQNDTIIPGLAPVGEYRLHAVFSTLRPGPYQGYAFVQGEFREADGSQVALCPRTLLRRTLETSKTQGLEFLVGFEIEIVFMTKYEGSHIPIPGTGGHAWSSARALHGNNILKMLEEIYDTLASSAIYLEQWHPESSSGQYEFILPPLPPLEAVDTLLHAREIIQTVVAGYDMRATLYPKPFPNMAGTASHVHLSISSPNGSSKEVWEPFYAGVLKHLKAILAFTYSNPSSYDRMGDGCWAGGRWVAWGFQNRETALRQIENSHFEIKVLDGLANAYFAMAAIIAAGTKGVVDKEKLVWGDCQVDPAALSEEEREKLGVKEMFPLDLEAALGELEADEVMVKLMGREMVGRYVAVKKAEMDLLGGMKVEERKEWIIERY
jgi:glutamine synthetase